MKKFFKLLCYSLITVFLLGFGGEKVLAVDAPNSFMAKEGSKWINVTQPYTWWSTVKTVNGGAFDGQYVYCLDSHKHIFTTGLMVKTDNLVRSYTGSDNYKSKIAEILSKAYRLGLGNGQSHNFTIDGKQYNVTDAELYGITQSAVWNAAHGHGEDGYTDIYQKWMKGKEGIFQYLIETDNFSYDLQITSDGNAMTVDGNYLVSGEYTVVSNVPTTLNASITNGQFSVNGGDWVDALVSNNNNNHNVIKVNNGDKIRLRVVKPDEHDDGEVSVTLTVASDNFVESYDVYTYAPTGLNTIDSKHQNLVLPVEHSGKRSASVTAIGNYSNRGTVKIRKVDSDGNPISDAYMVLVRKENENSTGESIIDHTISKGATDGNPEGYITYENLKPGYYCLEETKAPDGYVLNSERVCDTLVNNGTLPLEFRNTVQRVKYRKVDASGNPIAGVRVEIHNGVEESTNKKPNYPYLCGISGVDGYLTEKCPGWDDSNSRIISPDSNDSFPIGWDMDKNPDSYGGIYYVNEEFKDGYYNPDLAFGNTDPDFGFRDIYNPKTGEKKFGFGYANAVVANKGYITFNGNVGIDSEVTVNIINDRYINISKVDTGTGKEIPGAEMLLFDLGAKDYSIVEDLNLSDDQIPYQLADSWTSDGTPHTFIGIVPGHKYRLEETVAPSGKDYEYAKLETYIEFTVDANGKVELSTVDQHATVPEGYNYLIIGNDLIVNPPNTGISLLNKIAVGGLLVFVGYEVIKFRKMKANS